MTERVRHGCGGWIEHETDHLGRTVERCRRCGAATLVPLRVPVAARARAVLTKAERRRMEVLALVPLVPGWDEDFPPSDAVGLNALVPLVPGGHEIVRQALRMLETSGDVRAAFGRRVGRGPGQRTVKLYWRVG